MNIPDSDTASPLPPPAEPPPPSGPPVPPTPMAWRLAILASIVAVGGAAYLLREVIGLRGQSVAGIFCFFAVVAMFSTNLRRVRWKTIYWGFALQIALALLVLKVDFVREGFVYAGDVFKKFIGFSDAGAKFVFGNIADARPPVTNKDGKDTGEGGTWMRLFLYDTINEQGETVRHNGYMFQFAFVALPPILFVSAFFTLLYHFGILQFIVKWMAKGMVHLLGTSGAETLSVAANVFMGQTEAPLIVKPYVPRMTNSELFTLMTSGMAHISGGMMVVYINYGADPVAVLTTCVMACPGSLYLAKLFMPEVSVPETSGNVAMHEGKSKFANAIDAIASGTKDGLSLALNVAAMLIVFVAFVAMFDAILGSIYPDLSLRRIFGWFFAPVAFLMGVDLTDIDQVGQLLGTKLSMNEHVAYLDLKKIIAETPEKLSERSRQLVAFALTGFANFASIGIQLGGIGAMAPERRHDLARLGGRALFVGFTATLLNAAIAGVLI